MDLEMPLLGTCLLQKFLISVILHCLIASSAEGRRVLIHLDRYEASIRVIKSELSSAEEIKLSLARESPSASNVLQLLESNARKYEAFLQNGKSDTSLFPSSIEFAPYGNQSSNEGIMKPESIHELYGLGNKKGRRVKRGIPAIVGGVLGGGIGGCLGAADLFFLPTIGGLLGGLFGGGAGAGFGAVLEINPLSGPINSVLGGLGAALLGAVGGTLGGIVGPIGGCAGGGIGGAIGGGIGTILGTIITIPLLGPF